MSKVSACLDRLAPRARPAGTPVMHQRWDNLLFLHWPVSIKVMRTMVPTQLELDTFDNQAWIGITPFHLEDVHPIGLPPLLGTGSFHEINVRTYVIHNGMPGIWFFSLDASKILPAVAARALFMLPYHRSQMRFQQEAKRFAFTMQRMTTPRARFSASWEVGARSRDPDTSSLAFFLVERYCCFAVENGAVYHIRINHAPWILDEAIPRVNQSTLISSVGIPEPASEPLAHFARHQNVEIWAPRRQEGLPEAILPRV